MDKIKDYVPLMVLSIAFAVATLVGGITLASEPTLQDISGGKALHTSCQDAGPLLSALKSAAAAPADTGMREQMLRKLGLDPGFGVKSGEPSDPITTAQSGLEKRVKACAP